MMSTPAEKPPCPPSIADRQNDQGLLVWAFLPGVGFVAFAGQDAEEQAIQAAWQALRRVRG